MELKKVIDLVDRQQWLGTAASSIQKGVRNLFEAGGDAGRQVKNFLHGTWLGHPLHSVLTDVPVGAWTAALVLDVAESTTGRAEFGAGADLAVGVGAAGAAGAALAGFTDWSETGGSRARVGLVHAGLNTTALLLYLASLASRKQGNRGTGRALAYAGYLTVAFSAYLGGELVYMMNTGVDHAPRQPMPEGFVPVIGESELVTGQLRRVEAAGVPVLVTRAGGRLYALADTCSHLGCSLAEGHLEGDSIRCSCHGSRYALADGRVLDGPSTYDQPAFEVRVHNGQIEVRQPQA